MSLFSKPTLNLSVPEELMAVLLYYEDTCVMGCCGIDALNLDVQRAIDGMMEFGVEKAIKALAQLDAIIVSVEAHQGPVFSDQNSFGEQWDRSEEAKAFLESLRASLQAAVDTPEHLWRKNGDVMGS